MIPAEEQAQRQAALRALLAKPLLVAADDAESLLLVRRHLPALSGWLRRETGWRLVADTETARLFKTAPSAFDATHPARGHNREPFTRRRYVTLCLALSALARADAQTTLGSLADDVLTAAAEPGLAAAGFTLTLDTRSDRADLVAVVRLLLAWGVLSRVAGDEDAYLSAGADVLYDVRRPVLGVLLTGSRGPSTIAARAFEARLVELTAEPVAETDELRNQAMRRMLTRRLLDEPLLYYDELAEDERAYLVAQRHNITGRISEATGLLPELRAEGIAMVDPDDELTDVRMPEQRTDGHVTLLVAEYLAGRARAPQGELLAFVRRAAQAHASYWRKGVTDPGAETDLLDIALEKLAALRLIEVDTEVTRDGTGTVIRSRPAIARFALAEPTIREPGSPSGSKTPAITTRKATADAASTIF
ncbi:MAG: TIGR02678 family protein [Trebonia sp.]